VATKKVETAKVVEKKHSKKPKVCKGKGFWSAKKIIKKSCLIESYPRKCFEPHKCEKDEELIGHKCYPKCKGGYKTVGLTCVQECPKKLIDKGDFCKKPEIYKRTPGFPCNKKHECEEKSKTGLCEKFEELYYQKCKHGYHPVGCCICVPDCKKYPEGFKKHIYKRVGHLPKCEKDTKLVNGKCCPKCKKGFKGYGPLCYGECPRGLERCGVFCVKPGCILCNTHTNHVLMEVGLLIRYLIPGSAKEIKLNKKKIREHAVKKCLKLGKKKAERCLMKLKKLMKVIPKGKSGKPFELKKCKK